MTATPCTFVRCNRTTLHSSGRCHDHRSESIGPRGGTIAPPTPVNLRGDRPTVVRHDPDDGHLSLERWLDEARRNHREGAPAVIEYFPNGKVKREYWYSHGQSHRLDGPAETEYLPDGRPFAEYYRVDGQGHRYGGPSSVNYGLNGEIRRQGFSVHGVGFADAAATGRHLLTASDAGIEAELENTPYVELIEEGAAPRTVAAALAEGVTTVDGVREVLGGAPAEWVRSYEGART